MTYVLQLTNNVGLLKLSTKIIWSVSPPHALEVDQLTSELAFGHFVHSKVYYCFGTLSQTSWR